MSELMKPLTGEKVTATSGTSACSNFSGRMAMNQAVERQQRMLAEHLVSVRQSAEDARANRLGRYVELLGNQTELVDETVANEFNGLVREFYNPRNFEEECVIMDAGGSTYGV